MKQILIKQRQNENQLHVKKKKPKKIQRNKNEKLLQINKPAITTFMDYISCIIFFLNELFKITKEF